MDGIGHEKRLEVARYYILGLTYAEIEQKAGVSHGSVANVFKELEAGKLNVPGVASDEVSDLRQLSIELKKKGLQPSQALLGVTLFDRFTQLGIAPSQVDQWSKLVKKFSPDGFPAKEFFEAALHLHELEVAQGKLFQDIAREYTSLKQKITELGSKVDLLEKKNKDLADQAQSLTSEVITLKNEHEELKGAVKAESTELDNVKVAVVEAKEEHAQLMHEIGDLQKSKVKLCSEVDGKEKSLAALKEIGFSEADLLHLRNLLEGMAKKDGGSADQIKDRFFSALAQFGDLSGFQKAAQEEAKALQDMAKQKSTLAGEIGELESRKALLQGEIGKSATATTEQIQAASAHAITIIQHEADAIRQEVKSILEDTLVAGLAVGEASAVQKKSEQAGKELGELIGEVKRRLGGSR